ncbi:MAG: DEAD/DEAH box helicase [Parcubacteria group bacterium]|nr:DEAD/DEAH box helicase [Parcubacteria group bacterium]
MQNRVQYHAANSSFYGLGIAPAILEILRRLKFTEPTPIQSQAIPIAIQGKDMVGIAQTGTGKTLAFGIPMLQRLEQIRKRGLIVVPTRELALQVDEEIQKMSRVLGLRTAVLIGGLSIGPQIHALSKRPHIIIATPGRLIDHLEQRTIRLDEVGIVVLDEADRMLDMGFLPQIRKILERLPKERQTMLFSATMPPEIMKIAAASMKLPVRVEMAPSGTTVEGVTQELFIVPREQKIALLGKLLETYQGPTLVFSRTKHGATKILRHIKNLGVAAAEIHSNRTLGQRRQALEGFKSGRYRVLVATDIASRGIDVVGIELVINYDLPSTSDDYVHRIGRTARAGAQGHAITFAMPQEQHEVRAIERLIRKPLPISRLPELPRVQFVAPRPQYRSQQRPWSRRRSGYQDRSHRSYR